MEQPALRVPVPKRSIATVVAAILVLVIAGPALAEYLGPDRVTVEFKEVRDPDNDVWTLTHVDPNDGWSDVCLIIHTCEEHPSVERQQALCHWTADNSGCDRAYKMKEVTVVLPEATIGSDLQGCTLVDGWCTDSPTLHLEGAEPVAGQTITLIEGTRNGEPFACPGAVCDVPLVQGGNQFTFWALSSWGDSSQMGTLSAQVDSKGPKVSIPDSWYIWEPLAIQVQDDTNGIDKVSLTIDGGEYGDRSYSWSGVPDDFIWDRHFGEIIAPIGDYPVTVKAKDGLGNIASAHGEIVIPEPESPAGSAETSAPPQSAGPVVESSEDLAWLIDPYPLPSSGAAGSGDGVGLDTAGAEDAEQQASVLSGDESAGASAQVAAVPSGATTEGGGTGLLWGAAALAAAASATAYGLSRRRAREEYIREMRERAAEMSSPEARQARLTSLWNAAQARVAPIRAAMASGTRATATAATSAAAAVATAAGAALAAAASTAVAAAGAVVAAGAAVAAATAVAADAARRRVDEAMRQRALRRRTEREERLEVAETLQSARQSGLTGSTQPASGPVDSAPVVGSPASSKPPDSVVDLLPSFSFAPQETKNPLLRLGIIEAGAYEAWRIGVDLNPVVKITNQRFTLDLGRVSIDGSWEGNSVGVSIETPSTIRHLDEGRTRFTQWQSATLRLTWDGWNTSLSARYYSQEFTVNTEATLGASGSGTQGIYVEEKPIQGLVTVGLVVITTAAILTMGPAALDAVQRLAEQFKIPVLLPGT